MIGKTFQMAGRVLATAVFVLTAPAVSPGSAEGSGARPDCSGWLTVAFWKAATAKDAERCLAAGSRADSQGENSRTPLHYAAGGERADMVSVLIAAGANINAQARNGETPLHWAAHWGNADTVNALITAGANIDAQDADGTTPLHVAAQLGNADAVNALIVAGAKADVQGVHGETPLHYVLRWVMDAGTVVNALIAAGAKIDVQGRDGLTPLHYAAAFRPEAEMVRVLIAAGAKIEARDAFGRTPLHYAAARGRAESIIALLDAGANGAARTGSGDTAFDFARIYQAKDLHGTRAWRRLRQISPLVLDMDGDGIELVALSDSKAMFDLDRDGFAQHTGWVASDDALLALDRNDNGRIDDIDEVFGNGTVDGFNELAELDSNEDGTIDASDERFGDLLLWRDKNGDGRSEADELQGLAEGGVMSIDLDATESETTLAGHSISHTSSFTRTDETTDTIVDAWFENDRHISVYLPDDDFTLHEDVPALPDLTGYGVVPSLSVAMTLDAGLRQSVTDLVKKSDSLSLNDFRAAVETMVLDWTGADTTDPGSRGPAMDARHLAAMEALAGQGFEQDGNQYFDNPGPIAAVALEAGFQDYIDMVTVRLLAQSAYSDFLVAAKESPSTVELSEAGAYSHVFSHPLGWLATLPYRPETNELGGDLQRILDFYVSLHAEG